MSDHKGLRKAEEVNFKTNISFFTSLSATETHTLGVEFIGLYGTVIFIAIQDFNEKAICGVMSGQPCMEWFAFLFF